MVFLDGWWNVFNVASACLFCKLCQTAVAVFPVFPLILPIFIRAYGRGLRFLLSEYHGYTENLSVFIVFAWYFFWICLLSLQNGERIQSLLGTELDLYSKR